MVHYGTFSKLRENEFTDPVASTITRSQSDTAPLEMGDLHHGDATDKCAATV